MHRVLRPVAPPRQNPAVGYARHVGRVGVLAVALGVFGAVASSPGVAWAETPGSSATSNPAPSGSADGNTSNPSTDTSGATVDDAADDPQADPEPEPDDPDVTTGDDLGDDLGDDGVDGGGDAAATPDPTVSDGTDDVVVENPEELPAATPEPTPEPPLTGDDAPATHNDATPTPPPAVEPAAPENAAPPDEPVASANRTNNTHVANTNTNAALAAATDATPAAAANPLDALGKQIGTALNLPTRAEVEHQVRAAAEYCLCGVVSTITRLLNGVITPPSGPSPAAPAQNAMTWAVLGFVRRQVDYAVAAFNRTPPGQFVHQVGVAVTQWIADFGNSPTGRQISATVGAFIEGCNNSTQLPDEFDRTVVVGGLSEPTDFEFVMDKDHPDRIHKILFTEKSGTLKSYDVATGTTTTLANIGVVTGNGERGLIGIEVDPNFWNESEDGYRTIYVAYTNTANRDQLSSFTVSADFAGLTNEQKLVESTLQANEFHHGGELEFDPSGQYLYWAVGNNTTVMNSQDLTNIHGKILRLNRDGSAAAGNPFLSSTDPVTQRIYAYGLRNPFRMAFDPVSGALLAGDVGESKWEELNLVRPGANFGWPYAEGPKPGSGYADPLYAYPHSASIGSGSITSVMVYTDARTPAGQAKVLIADYSLGWIRELTFDDKYSSLISERTFDSGAGAVVKLAQAPNGDIYQLNIYPGTLSVITPSGGNRSPVAVITASQTSGPGHSLTVEFSGAQSTDPDGDDLQYSWNFGNGQTSQAKNPTVTFENTGSEFSAYTVTLTVTDGNKAATATQRIVVGSTAPDAAIQVTSPGGDHYNAGDTLTFHATGSDVEDGALPDSSYTWMVEFLHAEHKHPFLSEVEGPNLTMTVPTDYDQLADTRYRVILTVTDSSGLSTRVEQIVRPNLVTLTFGADDPQAAYTVDGVPRTGTYTEQAVVGVHRTISAVSPQTINGKQVVFGSWSDGGEGTHVIVTPGSNTTYTVTYVAAPVPSTVL